MSLAPVQHIEIDEKGVARIAGTRIKVIQIAMDKRFYGWGPEQIQSEHPHLTLADVHAALAFYYDHQSQLDAQIEQDEKDAEALRAAAGESPVAQRLKTDGQLSARFEKSNHE